MKNNLKKTSAVFMSLCLIVSILASAPFAIKAKALEPINKTVVLGNNAIENYYAIADEIAMANSEQLITITISESGTYPVSSGGGGAIMMRSNVVLDLNGATLVRSGDMNNILQNCDFKGERENGGYDQTYNFTVKNGTLDGNSSSTKEVNLVNFGHAQGIVLENLILKNCYNGHLIELSGCKDVTISNCIFTGYTASGSAADFEDKEAIQLDICGGSSWNGVYKGDNTVCQNVTVENCQFQNYPSGVGNHHTLTGKHNSNIRIINNTFTNALSQKGVAIWAYAFDNSLIQENTISGNYTAAIRVSGGSVDVIENTVSNVTYDPLYITVSQSYDEAGNSSKTSEPVSGGTVKNNTLTVKGAIIALKIFSGSKITEISGNTISSTGETAISCSSDTSNNLITTIGTIKSNKITSTSATEQKNYGISVAKGTKITTMDNNTISSKGNAINVTSGSVITNITNSPSITSSAGDGILITGENTTVTSIKFNTIKNCGQNGLNAASTAKVGTVQGNTISGCKNYGVWIKNSGITVSMGQNTYSSNTAGNEKISATVKKVSVSGLPAPALGSASNTCSGVKFTWTGNKLADKYRVFYKTSASGSWTKLADTAATNYTHTAAKSGTTYYYTVRPMNADGTYSGSYNTKGVSTKFVTAPKPSVANVNGGIKISWSASKGAAKYRVFIKNSEGKWTKLADTTGTSYTYKSVTAGKSYSFTVRCIDSAGKYCSSYYSGGKTIKYIKAPALPTLKNSSKGIVIKWGACTGAVKYRIFYKTSASGSWKKLADTTATSYTHTGAKNGTTYFYTVRCISSDGKTYTSAYNTTGAKLKCSR